MESYQDFLCRKAQLGSNHGFALQPDAAPFLFDFQRAVVEWATLKGRAAIFADCGLGKTPMQLAWADAVVQRRATARRGDGRVLIATPLAVAQQVLAEAEKFGIDCERSRDGSIPKSARIIVTNYERLHLFDPSKFCGAVCDESSILKNYAGSRRATITDFMRKMPFRLLCTATAAPNDYIELGTSSEALGELGHMDMLARFFRNEQNNINPNRNFFGDGGKWRFKGHAEGHFWRWVSSWARAARRPSDLGFDDSRFVLPPLEEVEHIVEARTKRPDLLFDLPATNIREEREERRRTIAERCEKVAELVDHGDQALVWCHLNAEGDMLERLIPGAMQVAGSNSDDYKEEVLTAFARGALRVLVTKPKIGAWGLNLQRCAHVTFFPSHSYEQYYQGVRRCWRFGQARPVRVDIVATDGEKGILSNIQRKAEQADRMFTALVAHMNQAVRIERSEHYTDKAQTPTWL